MAELHETRMGHELIDGTMKRIASALERIAESLEELNKKTRDTGGVKRRRPILK